MKIKTFFLRFIFILGGIGLINLLWVFVNYTALSDAYLKLNDTHQQLLIRHSNQLITTLSPEVIDTTQHKLSHEKLDDIRLITEPYYTLNDTVYARYNTHYFEYHGNYSTQLIKLQQLKQQLQHSQISETFDYLKFIFAASILLILGISIWVYRQFTRRFRRNIDQLIHSLKDNETERAFDFEELGTIHRELTKYQAISAQVERQNIVVDLMANWRMEVHKLIHDLKNPIQRLALTISHLQNESESKIALASIQEINDKLKDLRSAESADAIEPVKIDLNTFFERMKSLFYDISITILSEQEIQILFDQFGFQRIISNLTQNAIEAGANKIVYRFEERSNEIIIDVINNGEPIENKEKLFVPFATTKKEGTGLGLVIIMQIVHAHGGQFFLKKSDGSETIFRIVLKK